MLATRSGPQALPPAALSLLGACCLASTDLASYGSFFSPSPLSWLLQVQTLTLVIAQRLQPIGKFSYHDTISITQLGTHCRIERQQKDGWLLQHVTSE